MGQRQEAVPLSGPQPQTGFQDHKHRGASIITGIVHRAFLADSQADVC